MLIVVILNVVAPRRNAGKIFWRNSDLPKVSKIVAKTWRIRFWWSRQLFIIVQFSTLLSTINSVLQSKVDSSCLVCKIFTIIKRPSLQKPKFLSVCLFQSKTVADLYARPIFNYFNSISNVDLYSQLSWGLLKKYLRLYFFRKKMDCLANNICHTLCNEKF